MKYWNPTRIFAIVTLGVLWAGVQGTAVAQLMTRAYVDCEHAALLDSLRALEDQIAQTTSSPVSRGNYALNGTDPGVTNKQYALYRCEVLLDSIDALETRLADWIEANSTPDPPAPFVCGTSTVTYDGYAYRTVQIGSQCWFAENLRAVHYNNGDDIPDKSNPVVWGLASEGGQCFSSNDSTKLATYGRYYNAFAVIDSRGLCPTGYHVPSDSDWMALEQTLGMPAEELSLTSWRGTDQGDQMKASATDAPAWNGTNTSGFHGLGGGYRSSAGAYSSVGTVCRWWTCTFPTC